MTLTDLELEIDKIINTFVLYKYKKFEREINIDGKKYKMTFEELKKE